MRKHTILCLTLCLLLSGCGRLPTQEAPGAGSSSNPPMESSAVQQEEPTAPNSPESSSSVAAPEPSAPETAEEPSAPDAGESVTAGEPGTEPDVADSEPETPGETEHWLTVGRDTAHSSPYVFTAPEDGVYTFRFLGENTARLDVYVLEDAFEDGVRYLPQAYQPAALSADGAVPLKAGCWVYCFSSTDVFAAGAQSGVSSVLTVDYAAGTVEQGTVSQPW